MLTPVYIFTSCDKDDDETISVNDLPQEAQNFLSTHFTDVNVRLVERDNDDYEVYLNKGFEIDFFLNGEWKNVDGISQSLPQSVLNLLPQAILTDLNKEVPNSKIVKIEKEAVNNTFNGYEIKLDNHNGIERKYNKDGVLIEIDN